MSLLDALEQESSWQAYLAEKKVQIGRQRFAEALDRYIESGKYRRVVKKIFSGEPFPLPKKKRISKPNSSKKRVVYTYPEPENQVLKLLTYLLLREYDGLFSSNLYSFRPAHGAKEAIRRLSGTRGINRMYGYKADISDYFNSVDIGLLLPDLKAVLAGDDRLFGFLKQLLTEPMVRENGKLVIEEKGIMAGTPLACFYANLYLRDLDRHFEEAQIPYARYSDDVIVFAESREVLDRYVDTIHAYLSRRHLIMNPEKEQFSFPGEKWTYLGFSCLNGILDIAPASVKKLKGKMRRKRDALHRWQMKKGLSGDKAAKAFIRAYNRKLFDAEKDNDLTWTRWYFPVINTVKSLKEIDLYARDCIRYLISGTHTKARFNVRYGDLKALGYRSLVHAYYQAENKEENRCG